MKKIIGISMVLVLLILSGFINKVEKEKASDLKVFSIHELSIKPGVNEKEFKDFVMNEIAPLYRQMKGQDLFLAKGYVGNRMGQYAIFITFPTVKDRNRIYPLSGDGFSEEFKKVMEGKKSIWEKFDSMAEGFDGMHCTDYVKVDY
ncbi:MAG: hypothetical protein HQ522_14585 [Bacteroidetes bacterium]|nr:hypothetical protein [Bacteroidota bacterium]